MPAQKRIPQTIDAYIADFDPPIATILERTRKAIARAAPKATEKIAWGMPTFYLDGNLVHFAAAKKHLGFYPGGEGIKEFAKDLKPFVTSPGAVQFPYDQPIPYDLIQKITRFRVKQNTEWAAAKKARKSQPRTRKTKVSRR